MKGARMEVGSRWDVLVAMEGEEIREESRRAATTAQGLEGARRTLVGTKAGGRAVFFFHKSMEAGGS
jgi:hypothetical protein